MDQRGTSESRLAPPPAVPAAAPVRLSPPSEPTLLCHICVSSAGGWSPNTGQTGHLSGRGKDR